MALPKPRRFAVTVRLRFNLPWPLPDVKASGRIINLSDSIPPDLHPPLLLAPDDLGSELTRVGSPLDIGAYHWLTGRQWTLLQGEPDTELWPDTELVLPFSQRPLGPDGEPGPGDVYIYGEKGRVQIEGGFTVSHRLVGSDGSWGIKLYRWESDAWQPLPEPVQATWAAWKESTEIARLHLPSEDPFAWLTPLLESQREAELIPPKSFEQDFLSGDEELRIGRRRFGQFVVEAVDGRWEGTSAWFDLLYPPLVELGTRLLTGTHLELSFENPDGSPVCVSEVTITFASLGGPTLDVLKLDGKDVDLTMLEVIYTRSLLPVSEDSGVSNFALWSVRLTSDSAFSKVEVAAPWSDGCVSAPEVRDDDFVYIPCVDWLQLYTIRYTLAPIRNEVWRQRQTFKRGRYKLDIRGTSRVEGYGLEKEGAWSRSQEFRVEPPDRLRPYILFTTIGDSRIFGYATDRWNPTPFGRGFPVYKNHMAVVRFRTYYLSKIFMPLPDQEPLIVRITHDSANIREYGVTPRENLFEQRSLPAASIEYRRKRVNADQAAGAPLPLDEELRFSPELREGMGSLDILYVDPTKDGEAVPLDSWSFEGSRYEDFNDHMSWSGCLCDYFGPSGRINLPAEEVTGQRPQLEPEMAVAADGWENLTAIADKFVPLSNESSLAYLRLAERLSSRLRLGATRALQGLVNQVNETRLSAVVDRQSRPYVLWLRTPEPIDWRRVEGTLTVFRLSESGPNESQESGLHYADAPPVAFDIDILPSPDATSAFLLAKAGGVSVRFPRGQYKLVLKYKLVVDNLPTQLLNGTEDVASPLSSVEATLDFLMPLGIDWPSGPPREDVDESSTEAWGRRSVKA